MPEHPNTSSKQPLPQDKVLRSLFPSHSSKISQESRIFCSNGPNQQSSQCVEENIEELDSDSGTRADDENILKKLSATKIRYLQAPREADDTPKDQSGLALLSNIPSVEVKRASQCPREPIRHGYPFKKVYPLQENMNILKDRRLECLRRSIEVGIVIFICGILRNDAKVCRLINIWKRELTYQLLTITTLLVLHLLRNPSFTKLGQVRLSSIFFALSIPSEIAPLLYPPCIPILVSLILFRNQPLALLPSLILGITSIPQDLVPYLHGLEGINIMHWSLSLLPLFLTKIPMEIDVLASDSRNFELNPEVLVFLHPLHHSLCATIKYLTATSLLPAESQLLSVALIHLLLHAKSPQAIILKSLLWGGGIGVLLSCGYVLKWGLALSRVPKWRFKREEEASRFLRAKSIRRIRENLSIGSSSISVFAKDSNIINSSDEGYCGRAKTSPINNSNAFSIKYLAGDGANCENNPNTKEMKLETKNLSGFLTDGKILLKNKPPSVSMQAKSDKRTSSGRRKREISPSEQSLSTLTFAQASVLKFVLAVYAYFCIIIIILVGIRGYVQRAALSGREPIGWAFGYLFGDLPKIKKYVESKNLQQWIQLPPVNGLEHEETYRNSRMELLRKISIGEANTRLIICGYWLSIITIGLVIVMHISSLCQVDTRRKIFHLMMVAMLLPATYVDPTFAALALSLMLAIFLLLDIFRASRLPPLSKSLAYFLEPFVDARDLRGPVVVSHTFLLIGCAIPLWLSLSTLTRTGVGPFVGWDVSSREVSMVSGVICVGIGDAAASLIGRRYGHHKWFWGGTKSIEGSAAFATAVGIALSLAKAWLKTGGWQANNYDPWALTLGKVCVAAFTASLTEAVITGVNDNVIVPIVLWLCVKGLDL
ncbi:hypothetical protein K3495_g8481 [Podosphaera aphanis]|nr:hypothetical protein K3495_g8481 [Podosphaera aphanis]